MCFSSLRRHFSLFALCFLFLRFFIVTFLDHRYFFWFSFINLFLGLFKKFLCFPDKRSKISFFFLFSFWKKSLLFFFLEISFLQYICFFMRDLENILSFLCFQSLFLWNYFVSLCFCPKEKWLVLFTFSLHSSSSSWFVLSSCVLSLCLLSLLLLFQLTKIWLKKKNLCFTILLRTIFPKKWQKHSFFFSEGSSFSLFFYSLPLKKSIFCKQTHVLSVFSLCISPFQKLSQQRKPNRRAIWDSKRQIDVVTF